MDPNQIKKITEIVTRLNSGIIALQNNPSMDGVAAGTALYLALSKMGKTMSIVCSSKPQFDLTGVDKIQSAFVASGNHLVISFPYTEGAIDKVDYNIAGNSFNLILVPTGEASKIDPKDVKFSYTGGKIEFVITVDVPNLNSLGPIYTENQNEFQGKNIINIDRHLINNNFGTVNVVNKSISSTSEIVYQVVRDLGVEIDKDIATNLYNGLLAATNNFTAYSVNQNTFEASAELMKLGAVKKAIPQAKPGFGGAPGFGGQPGGFGVPGGSGFGAPAPGGAFGNPGGFGGFSGANPMGGPNPIGGNPMGASSPFGGFGNPGMGGRQPMGSMNSPMMDDFDDFDDFDDMPMPGAQPPMPFGQMQGGMNRSPFPQQPPMRPIPPPMNQQPYQPLHQSGPAQMNPQSMQRPMGSPLGQQQNQQMPQGSQAQQDGQQGKTQQNSSPLDQNSPLNAPGGHQQQSGQGAQQDFNQQQGVQQEEQNKPKSPQDWLKPKLFRGNNLI